MQSSNLSVDEQRIADAVVAAIEPRFAAFEQKMNQRFTDHMTELEGYYSENYEKALEKLDTLTTNQESILTTLTAHDKLFKTLDEKVDATKAASETAHAEIIKRLERIENGTSQPE